MRGIAISTLRDFWTRHPDSEQALKEWYVKTERAQWKSLNDIRKDAGAVDYVKNQRYVFNIKGNDYRMVVMILFTPKTVYIRFVGTHSEYEAIKDIKNI